MLHALRLAAFAALAAFGALAPAAPACACSCGLVRPGAYTLAVRGVVMAVEIRDLTAHDQAGVATIAVSEVLRGPEGLETVNISYPVGDGVNCGMRFSVGQRGTFVAGGAEGGYGTNLCITGNFFEQAQPRPQR